MRDIKFRGLHMLFKEWRYGNLTILTNDNSVSHDKGSYISNSTGSRPFAYQVCPETVSQFTGLLDSQGVEIYDGDIFIAPHDFGPGGLSQRQAVVSFHKENGYQWQYWDLEKLKIIGNIHEHAELLKKGEGLHDK